MKSRILSWLAMSVFSALVLFGCGGGGGGGSSTPQPPAGTNIIATIGLTGTLNAGQSIGGVDVVLNLPAGVSAVADGTGETAAGVVVPVGGAAGSLPVGKYTAAAGGNPGTVRVVLVKTAGFSTGDFVTINLAYTAGSKPNQNDFSTGALSVIDASNSSTAITGLTTTLNAQIF
jgi:hypothetical protein